MKSYNQFACEIYDLQESGQIHLTENPFRGALTRFRQSPAGKALNKGYRAISTNPIVNNRITRGGASFLNRLAIPTGVGIGFVDRRKRGQSMIRSTLTPMAQTAASYGGAKLGGAKGAALCALGGPAAAAVCGTAGAAIGGYAGWKGSGMAIDAVVDATKRKPPKPPKPQTSATGAVGTTGDALGSRLPRINK